MAFIINYCLLPWHSSPPNAAPGYRPNRHLLTDRLEHALAHARRHDSPLAVLFLDLDRFKMINDSLGHKASDQLPGEVARQLQGCIRDLYPCTVRILLSGQGNMEVLMTAINQGAIFKFLAKPVPLKTLPYILREAFLFHQMQSLPRTGRTLSSPTGCPVE